MKKQIGIYGGTFDPFHFGHLNLAFEIMEKRFLDEVWFVPAQINPHKRHSLPISVHHRLAMLHAALDQLPFFKIKDLELERPPPSYTIDTIRTIIEEGKNSCPSPQFYFIMGEDAMTGFSQWHLSKEIIKLVPLLIGSRYGFWKGHMEQLAGEEEIRQALQQGLIQTSMMDISSSNVRERLHKNLYCGHLVPTNVLNYIQQNQLYV